MLSELPLAGEGGRRHAGPIQAQGDTGQFTAMDQHFHRPLTIKPPALWELVREGKRDWARPQKHQKWKKY